MTARRRRPRPAARRARARAVPPTPARVAPPHPPDLHAGGPPGRTGVTWKRDVAVEPAATARAAFLSARGLANDRAATGTDPLLAIDGGAWRAMMDHARSAPVEVGGVLVGEVFRDEAGGLLVDIAVAIPALGALQEPAYFRLTEAAWEHISRQRAALHPALLTVGWYHTHPGMGVFFSGTDRASQRAFFNRPWSVGFVIDPARDELALFRGADCERLSPAHLVVYDAGAATATRDGIAEGVAPGGRRADRGPDARWQDAAGTDAEGSGVGVSAADAGDAGRAVAGVGAERRGDGGYERGGSDAVGSGDEGRDDEGRGGRDESRPYGRDGQPQVVRARFIAPAASAPAASAPAASQAAPTRGAAPTARPTPATAVPATDPVVDAATDSDDGRGAGTPPAVPERAPAGQPAPIRVPWAALAALAGAAVSIAFAARAGARHRRGRR